MVKSYVKINGVWVRVFEVQGWLDIVCWVGAFATIGITAALVWVNVL